MSGRKGKGAVRDAVAGAAPAQPTPGPGSGAPAYLAARFEMTPDGLFRRNHDDTKTWISGPFAIEAELRDDEGRAWGLLISWRDRDGARHEEAFGRSLFAGECAEVRSRLADSGLSMSATQNARQALAEYLNVAGSPVRARSVSRVGWHMIGGRPTFVLPEATFGTASERVILQTEARESSLFNVAGTAEEWRDSIGRLCSGNSRLEFAVSAAFAGPLLGIVGEDGGGINFRGRSRIGKTTLLRAGASVCGGTASHGGAGYVRQWRATANGLETVAAAHSDGLLVLDEMGQVDPREAAEFAYLLANGLGKARASRSGLARPALRFRVLFLSSGEKSLTEIGAEFGRRPKAGEEVRLADVPADAGAGLGCFEELHEHDNAVDFISALKTLSMKHYGAPLRAFLELLADRWGAEPIDFADECRRRAGDLVRGWLAELGDATGQVQSVAHRFAIIALAGELATEELLTGWGRGAASDAARRCFIAWVGERGSIGAREDAQAVQQLRDFIVRHGASRFEEWTDPPPGDADAGDAKPPLQRFRVQNRAGWRRWEADETGRPAWVYYLASEGLREALAGLAFREAVGVLAAANHIVAPESAADLAHGARSRPYRIPGEKSLVRLYKIGSVLLASKAGDAP